MEVSNFPNDIYISIYIYRFQIVCSTLRMGYLAYKMVFFCPHSDVIFVDGVSSCIPILKLSGSKVFSFDLFIYIYIYIYISISIYRNIYIYIYIYPHPYLLLLLLSIRYCSIAITPINYLYERDRC